MTDDFDIAVTFVLLHECVYTKGHYGDLAHVVSEHVKNDPGGTTKFGIDQRDHPNIDVENLDLDSAKSIYHANEWFWCNGDDLPSSWSTIVFDTCVNPGRRSLQWLQAVVGTHVDGAIGPATIAKLVSASADARSIFLDRCEVYYRNLAESHSHLAPFLQGWLNRNNDRRQLLVS